MSHKISIALVAAITVIGATPALAADKKDDQSSLMMKDQSAAGTKTRYCVKARPVTGSILQARICKTADEWRAEGLDVEQFRARN